MAEPRRRLREKLGLPTQARIVLAVGYADRRKGVDLLVEAATRCCARSVDTHFVWVGHREVGLQAEIDGRLPSLTQGVTLVAAGLGDKVGDYAALALLD